MNSARQLLGHVCLVCNYDKIAIRVGCVDEVVRLLRADPLLLEPLTRLLQLVGLRRKACLRPSSSEKMATVWSDVSGSARCVPPGIDAKWSWWRLKSARRLRIDHRQRHRQDLIGNPVRPKMFSNVIRVQ